MAASDRPFFTPANLETVDYIRYADGSVEVRRSGDFFAKPPWAGGPDKDEGEPEC